ncbi:MAG TPA: transcriptional repressor [Candidatus Polarisedimenticolia bacterium]|nr:transcriptional repressor [Candidatus Polarisedimenticolia bacterium]
MDATGRFERYLAVNRLKMTRSRRAILEEILAVRGHFTADDLLAHFRRRGREVAPATLYRTLARLVEAGLVHRIDMAKGQARYEPMVGRHHHDHMVCVSCGKILEFENRQIERLVAAICRRRRFQLIEHTHQLRGRCSACARSSRSSSGQPAVS